MLRDILTLQSMKKNLIVREIIKLKSMKENP